ncbi:MAG: hypothetical protein AAB131_14555 [Actinomycetota bacterium]
MRTHRIIASVAIATAAGLGIPQVAHSAPTSAASCAGGVSAAELQTAFHHPGLGPGGLVGEDYQRAQPLPDGRVLWTFQDVYLGGSGSNFGSAHFVHNVGLVQTGSCYEILRQGTARSPKSWIGGESERQLRSWLWPLDSVPAADGTLAQFMVKMQNPTGKGAAPGAEPVGVWIAKLRLSDLSVISLQPAPDSGDRPLYGFSVTSDQRYTYLYGNCYRQFTNGGFPDDACGPKTYVARVPLGRPDVTPQYWNGTAWSADRTGAAPVMTRGNSANAMQVRRIGSRFVAVTKIDDWFGSTVAVDVAISPTGPWTPATSFITGTVCAECNTYAPHLLPWADTDGALMVAISNNAFDMRQAASDPTLYRPSFVRLTLASGGPLTSTSLAEIAVKSGGITLLPVRSRS